MVKEVVDRIFGLAGLKVTRVVKSKDEKHSWECWPANRSVPFTDFEVDNRFHKLYNEAQEATDQTSTDNPLRRQRQYTLNHLLWNTDLTTGEVCELGCFRGLSAYQIATHLKSLPQHIPFHIFDSFEGLSEIKDIDRPKDMIQDDEFVKKSFACSEETVRQHLSAFDFIEYHKGWIPERFSDVADTTFSFVHVDVDLYQPIKDSIEFFYPRLAKNGIIVFDDYGLRQFPGAKKAVDEYVASLDNPFFIPLPSGQSFLIKDFANT